MIRSKGINNIFKLGEDFFDRSGSLCSNANSSAVQYIHHIFFGETKGYNVFGVSENKSCMCKGSQSRDSIAGRSNNTFVDNDILAPIALNSSYLKGKLHLKERRIEKKDRNIDNLLLVKDSNLKIKYLNIYYSDICGSISMDSSMA